MKKKAMTLVVALAVIAAVAALVVSNSNQPNSRQEALKQAQEFTCDRTSLTVVTPAIHTATGAEYDFGSSCLPKGWEARPE